MFRFQLFILISCVFSSIWSATLDRDPLKAFPIVIFPMDPYIDSADMAINRQVSSELVEVLTSIGRFKVYDRNEVGKIIEEAALQMTQSSQAVQLDILTPAAYGMDIEILNFSQEGVAPSDFGFGDAFINNVFGVEEEFADNIETRLTYKLNIIELKTNEVVFQTRFEGFHLGGRRGESLQEVSSKSRAFLKRELKNLFKIESQIKYDDYGDMIFTYDPQLEVKKGTWFYLKGQGQALVVEGDTLSQPTIDYALAQVDKVGDGWARLALRREWDEVEGPYYAHENHKQPTGILTSFQKNLDRDYSSLLIDLQFSPMEWNTGIARIQFARPQTSRDSLERVEDAFGFGLGFGGGLAWRLGHTLTIRPSILADFMFFSRSDDKNRIVNGVTFSTPIHLDVELSVSKHWNLSVGAGYRTWGNTETWTFEQENSVNDNTKTVDAFWADERGGDVELQTQGITLRAGLSYLFL